MPNFLQGILGAGAGFLTGGPAGAVIGGISGLEGQGSREDPQMKAYRQQQDSIARQFMQQAQGVPGADPASLAALAQARGALGADQRQAQQGLYGQYNPQQGTGNLADMMGRLQSSFTAQQMSLQEQHMMNALAQRQQALLNAANVGRSAASLYQPRQSELSQLLGQVAQQMAYRQQRGKGGTNNIGGITDYNASNDNPLYTPTGAAPGFAGPAPAVPSVPPALSLPPSFAGVGTGGPDATTAAAPAAPPAGGGAGGYTGPNLGLAPATPPFLSYGSPAYLQGDDPAMTAAATRGIPQPINALGGGYNINGQAALANQQRQAAPLTGPAAQRFLHLPGGVRLPYTG